MSDNLPTRREWLVKQGLAKDGVVGRFSKEAHAALAKAEAEGVKFAANAAVAPSQDRAEITEAFDPKQVRLWAAKQGITLGVRGRVPTSIVARYLQEVDGNERSEVPTSTLPTPTKPKERVREQTVAWGFARRKDGQPEYISEPLVVLSSCGRCGEGVSYCRCSSGPYTPSWMGGETALLTKPE